MQKRFQLEDATIHAFGDKFLVVCPRCSRRAVVQNRGHEADGPRVVLTCGACGYSRFYEGDWWSTTYSRAVDWYFHLPLWLQASCCGEMLWAYNLRHLAFIEDFVQATLRTNVRDEHGWSNQSLRNRLPSRIKDPHNRAAILRCIATLRLKAVE
jgi:hypothetical protein